MNAINVITPYFYGSTWVFDDPERGLVKEPFVAGADTLISMAVRLKGIRKPEKGFRLTFSEHEFPGHDLYLVWVRPEGSGNVYKAPRLGGAQGWLCPALLKYFEKPPKRIYVRVDSL